MENPDHVSTTTYKDILDARRAIDTELTRIDERGRRIDRLSLVFGVFLPIVALVLTLAGLVFGSKTLVEAWMQAEVAQARETNQAERDEENKQFRKRLTNEIGRLHVVYGSFTVRFDREDFEKVDDSEAGRYWIASKPLSVSDLPGSNGANMSYADGVQVHMSLVDWRQTEINNPLPNMRVYASPYDNAAGFTMACQILEDELPDGRRINARVMVTGPGAVNLE